MRGGSNRLLTPKQHQFFAKHHVGRTREEITGIMNKKFGLHLTAKQVKIYRKNHHLNSGLTGRFEKGSIPWNKGRKYDAGGRSRETQFRKGNMPHNHRPVGSERMTKDGYIEVKIAEPNKWRGKHVLVWEALHGARPKGFNVIFADGDHRNFDPENLLLVSHGELAIMNHFGLITKTRELTKTGHLVAKVISEMTKAKKRGKGGEGG